VENRSSDY